MPNVSKLTEQEKQAIIDKSPLTMPTNPTKSGWSDAQIKQRLAQMVTDEQDSVIAALDKIVDNVNNVVNVAVGNVVIFTALPQDLSPYEQMYILIKDANNDNIINSFFIKNGVANQVKFGTGTEIYYDTSPPPLNQTINGMVWFQK